MWKASGQAEKRLEQREILTSDLASFAQIVPGSDPTLPLGAELATGQWGSIRRIPWTEQIGDLRHDRRWRGPAGPATRSGRPCGWGGRSSGELGVRGMEREDDPGLVPRPSGKGGK